MNDDLDGSLDEAIDALPENRLMIAFDRAWKKIGYVDLDDDIEANESLMKAYEHELIAMVMQDTMDELQKKGLVEPDRVDEDGEVYYKLTKLGEEVAKSASEEQQQDQ